MARPRIVVVGAGFAGLNALRRMERRIPKDAAELVLITPNDYMLYQPLLPQVASGLLTPQSIAVSLHRLLRRTKMVPGAAIGVDTKSRTVVARKISGETTYVPYDRLVLVPGSNTRVFDIPGLIQHGRGNKNLAEAVYLRDHVLAQLELANASDDPQEREERCTFLVVGGGYTGVETAASLELLCEEACKRYPRLRESISWHLIDIAPRLMPELGESLGDAAMNLLRQRGVQVSLGVSVKEATEDKVTLTDDRVLPCRTLIWTAGTSPSPLMEATGLATNKGKLVVGADLAVPGSPEILAAGDSAAVPDLSKDEEGALCPPTAQHAMRQGHLLADNVIASLLGQPLQEYRHKDLGLLVDLSGRDAVARPLGKEITGLPALGITRAYHLYALPSGPGRARVATNWAIRALLGGEVSRLGFLNRKIDTLVDPEETSQYLDQDQVRQQVEMARGAV
ncbi:NAD(P)/FAD-dependent oxidoreductase [Marinactinospora thermotolerans]|uniref:NADH dehydrogenase n=1 Tax=Marinactinospora thermotolerans DSM 45154 TaxID=1122192 RepID=A0A1T4M6U5_9ACTN|nr:NAD(P)/FAD-dependent oxidoreductase [Marinactinospora thermotolerans]SJZ62713.1 NADH dehydrogenase [Marinactinospora thermotolerans DSM 45154]